MLSFSLKYLQMKLAINKSFELKYTHIIVWFALYYTLLVTYSTTGYIQSSMGAGSYKTSHITNEYDGTFSEQDDIQLSISLIKYILSFEHICLCVLVTYRYINAIWYAYVINLFSSIHNTILCSNVKTTVYPGAKEESSLRVDSANKCEIDLTKTFIYIPLLIQQYFNRFVNYI